MDRKPLLWIVAVVVASVAGWQLASAQGDKEKAVQKWEYLREVDFGQERFNSHGKDGWELVQIVQPEKGYTPYAYFKRPK